MIGPWIVRVPELDYARARRRCCEISYYTRFFRSDLLLVQGTHPFIDRGLPLLRSGGNILDEGLWLKTQLFRHPHFFIGEAATALSFAPRFFLLGVHGNILHSVGKDRQHGTWCGPVPKTSRLFVASSLE